MKENVCESVFLLSVYFISILSVRLCVCMCVPVPQMIQYKKNKFHLCGKVKSMKEAIAWCRPKVCTYENWYIEYLCSNNLKLDHNAFCCICTVLQA